MWQPGTGLSYLEFGALTFDSVFSFWVKSSNPVLLDDFNLFAKRFLLMGLPECEAWETTATRRQRS